MSAVSNGQIQNSHPVDSRELHTDEQAQSPHRRTLQTVVPFKYIFVSRFVADTTEEDVVDYIKDNLKSPNLAVTASKFHFNQPRFTASFKLRVPSNVFELIMQLSFWPQNTIVHEFVNRNPSRATNAVSLPQNSGSKN